MLMRLLAPTELPINVGEHFIFLLRRDRFLPRLESSGAKRIFGVFLHMWPTNGIEEPH
jgi:hypothetical protein